MRSMAPQVGRFLLCFAFRGLRVFRGNAFLKGYSLVARGFFREALTPILVTGQGAFGHANIPAISIPALRGDFIDIVVDAFIAIAEKRTVRSDLVVPRPYRPSPFGPNQSTAL